MTSLASAHPILDSPFLVDLYDKVTENQEAFFEVLREIFSCQQIALVEYTPKERLYLVHHSEQQENSFNLTLPTGPFIVHGRQALLFIGNNGFAGVYLALTYCDPEHASHYLTQSQTLGMLNHIKQATTLALRVKKQSAAMNAIFYAIDHYPIPAIAIDQHRRSVFRNQAAKRLMLEHSAIASNADLLGLARDGAENKPLKHALSRVFAGEINFSHQLKLVLNNTALPVIITSTPAAPNLFSNHASGKLAWLYVLQPDYSNALRHNPRLKQLGLSPTEMELTLLLFEGISLQEIADHRAVSRQTVRKQLQSVFRKTHCETQEGLMLFLFEQFIQYDLI